MSLTVVPPEEYQQFADALREFHPHSYQIEAMLRGHLRYGHFDVLGARLCAPADTTHRHHLAIISPVASEKEIASFSIHWNEHHLSDDDVYQLLRTLPTVTWNMPVMVRQMPLHLQPKMDGIMLKLSDGELHLFTSIPVRIMTLTPDNAPPVPRLPEGYHFGTLDGRYAEDIHGRWIGGFTETIKGMSHFLDKLPSAAVFYSKHPNGACKENANNIGQEDELVAYSVYKHGSDMGMTYTKDAHRRKGLASAVSLKMAHKVFSDGLPVSVIIDFDYKLSQKMHKGIGFTHYSNAAIPFYFPKKFDFDSVPSFSNFLIEYSESTKKWNETQMTN